MVGLEKTHSPRATEMCRKWKYECWFLYGFCILLRTFLRKWMVHVYYNGNYLFSLQEKNIMIHGLRNIFKARMSKTTNSNGRKWSKLMDQKGTLYHLSTLDRSLQFLKAPGCVIYDFWLLKITLWTIWPALINMSSVVLNCIRKSLFFTGFINILSVKLSL